MGIVTGLHFVGFVKGYKPLVLFIDIDAVQNKMDFWVAVKGLAIKRHNQP